MSEGVFPINRGRANDMSNFSSPRFINELVFKAVHLGTDRGYISVLVCNDVDEYSVSSIFSTIPVKYPSAE